MAWFPFDPFSGGGGLDAGAQWRFRFAQESGNPPEEWSDWMWGQVRGSNYSIDMLPPGMTPAQARERDPQVIAQRQQAEQQALTQQIASAQQTAPAPPPAAPAPPPAEPTGPTPEEQLATLRSGALSGLEGTLPSGFEQSYIPGTATDPFEQQAYTTQRSEADKLISNMLKRGVLTESGRAKGIQALEAQAPGARSRLDQIGQLLIEQERAGLRGIAGTGRAAAGALELGQTFDPETYRGQVAQRAGAFTQGLPTSYAAQVPAGLFDVGGLGAASGAVTGQSEPAYDPYAVEGGQLKAEEEGGAQEPKKRRTSIF